MKLLEQTLCRVGMHEKRIVSTHELDEDIASDRAYVCPHCETVQPLAEMTGIGFVHQQPPAEFLINMEFGDAKAVLEDLEKLNRQHELNDPTKKLLAWMQKEVGGYTENTGGGSE